MSAYKQSTRVKEPVPLPERVDAHRLSVGLPGYYRYDLAGSLSWREGELKTCDDFLNKFWHTVTSTRARSNFILYIEPHLASQLSKMDERQLADLEYIATHCCRSTRDVAIHFESCRDDFKHSLGLDRLCSLIGARQVFASPMPLKCTEWISEREAGYGPAPALFKCLAHCKHMKELSVSLLYLPGDGSEQHNLLAEVIRGHSCLEKFECTVESSIPSIILDALATIPNLKRVGKCCLSVDPTQLDLVQVKQTCLQLITPIKLTYDGKKRINSDETNWNAFLEAFKAYDFIVTPDSPMDVFYPQLTSREYTTIWYIDSLKRHGRGYMKETPFDSNKGYELLGKVRYSLDCLYLHLRENPALCYGKRNSLLEDLDTKPAAKRRKT